MFCTNCGKELDDDAKTCPYCGAETGRGDGVRPSMEADAPAPVQPAGDAPNQARKADMKITVKGVLRVLALLCIVFVFCPSFLVSCSGENVGISAMAAAGGVTVYGQEVSDPNLVMLLCLLIPAMALALTIVKKFTDRTAASAILIGTCVDLVVWVAFRSVVKKAAEENLCGFKTTAWYVLNIISLLLMILLSATAVMKKIQMDTELLSLVSKQKVQKALGGISGKAAQAAGAVSQLAGNSGAGSGSEEGAGGIKAAHKKAVYGAAAAAVVLAAVIAVSSNAGKTVNLNDYLEITAEGYDGFGSADITIDWGAIEEKYGTKLKFTKAAKAEYGQYASLISPMDVFRECVRVRLDEKSGLSNGDEIAYTWVVDEDLTEYIDCKVKYKDGAYAVTGLEEVGTFDAFADLDVEFTGTAPFGKVSLEYTGSELSTYSFSCDKDDGLENGDTVTISIDSGKVESCAENFGRVPEQAEKEYKVEGLDAYASSLSDINEEALMAMQQQAVDEYNAKVAQNWSESSSLESLEYVGAILLKAKSGDIWGDYNRLYLVYKAQARNTYSGDGGSYDEVHDVYWYIRYNNVSFAPDGTAKKDITDYETVNHRFTVDSGINNGWFSTARWDYSGYETYDDLYKAVVTSNLDSYNYETDISEAV